MAAPIENSPPGTQTIPSGALPGGRSVFAVVGSNPEVPANASHCARIDATMNGNTFFLVTPARFMVLVPTSFEFRSQFMLKANTRFNRPLMIADQGSMI